MPTKQQNPDTQPHTTCEAAESIALSPESSRRHFLQRSAAGTIAGFAAAAIVGLEFAVPLRSAAQSKLTPDAALQELIDGNHRFMSGKLNYFNEDLEILK